MLGPFQIGALVAGASLALGIGTVEQFQLNPIESAVGMGAVGRIMAGVAYGLFLIAGLVSLRVRRRWWISAGLALPALTGILGTLVTVGIMANDGGYFLPALIAFLTMPVAIGIALWVWTSTARALREDPITPSTGATPAGWQR